MAGVIDTLRQKYRSGDMLVKFLFINIGVFVVLRIAALVLYIAGLPAEWPLQWLGMPASGSELLTRPWTVLTYMFVHYDILHILFNMLWLYWLGRIFIEVFTPKHFVALYIYGGIAGALLYAVASNLSPVMSSNGLLIGASASVMAIVVASAMRSPDYQVGLLFFGNISLKWIALVSILIDMLSIDMGNIGGNIAHLGGIGMGALFAWLYGRGIDIAKPFNRTIDKIVSHSWQCQSAKTPNARVADNRAQRTSAAKNASKSEAEVEMDTILEKIKHSGYASLTPEEKNRLFDVTKKV